MEILKPKLRIIIDSSIRAFLNEFALGRLPDTGGFAPPRRSEETQAMLNAELQTRNKHLKNAVEAGLESNSFEVYRSNL